MRQLANVGHDAIQPVVEQFEAVDEAAQRSAARMAAGAANAGTSPRGARVGAVDQQRHEGDAVGHGMVGAEQHRDRAAATGVQQQAPQRPLTIEIVRDLGGDRLAQLAFVVRLGQALNPHVVTEILLVVEDPAGRTAAGADPLPEPRIAQQPFDQGLLERRGVNRSVELEHRTDHHRIAGLVHLQPGAVHGVHHGHAGGILHCLQAPRSARI
jgi:hypothetical protein